MAGESSSSKAKMESEKFQEEAIDSDSDMSGHSNESSDGSETEQIKENKIKELEDQVQSNPYHYDSHVELISLLRKAGELERLREARELMSKYFPLTSDLWVDWLTDETKLVSTKEDREKLEQLFQRAVKDYLSIPVWLEYAQFSIGGMEGENGMQNVRAVFENALTSGGLHVTEGSMLWEAYREFELAILSSLKTDEELEKQRSVILSLFRRQLSVPLFDMEKTHSELEEWNQNSIDASIKNIYQKSLKKLKVILPYEEQLLSAEVPRLKEYLSYLDFEVKEGEPTRIQCLFERALVDNCLQPSLWKKYTEYLDMKLKIGDVSLPVHERAVRNCPWSAELWNGYITALERYNQGGKVKEVLDSAFNSGITQPEDYRTLWMAYLYFLRRKINWNEKPDSDIEHLRNMFQKAVDHLYESFGQDGDPNCVILQYWATVEGRFCDNLPQARELWNQILNSGYMSSAHKWMEYANMERAYGDSKHYRKVLLRGLMNSRDWPETLGDALIKFEKEEGTLETLDTAKEKYASQMAVVEQKRTREAERIENKIQLEMLEASKARKRKLPPKPEVDEDGFKIPQMKRKGTKAAGPPQKKVKEESTSQNDQQKRTSSAERVERSEAEAKPVPAPVPHNPDKDMYTAFLSNLDYSVEEDVIRRIFEPLGTIESLRLVRDYKGRSKGYCYVEYSTREAVLEALKLDRHPIDGRPIFVSPCKNKSNKGNSPESKLKYSTSLEKNKLFVRGLPFSKTQEDIREMFKEFGDIKDVRVVTYRNGHSKGLAYVDFQDESSATKALLKMDGISLEDNLAPLSVAYSNPPARKGRPGSGTSAETSFQKALGGPSREAFQQGSRGRSQASQVAFVPRALKQAPAQPTASQQNGASDKPAKMSNDDFRNLLLKK